MLVIGAGAIGMELGYVARAYGVDVTIVEHLDRALPNEDPTISREIAKAYKKLGIGILTSTTVESGRRDRSRTRPSWRGSAWSPQG